MRRTSLVVAKASLFVLLALTWGQVRAVTYQPFTGIDARIFARPPGGGRIENGPIWICKGQTATFWVEARDEDNQSDPVVYDGVQVTWTGKHLPDGPDLPTRLRKGNVYCLHDLYYGTEVDYTFEEPGTYELMACIADCPLYADDPDLPPMTYKVHVMGGPITQVSPAPPAGATVYWDCLRGGINEVVFKAAPDQPVETIYHWQLSNTGLARFKVGNQGHTELRGTEYETVTVAAIDGRAQTTHDVKVRLTYEHGSIVCPCSPIPPEEAPFISKSCSGIQVVSQTGPDQIPNGWAMDTFLRVVDQCDHAFDHTVRVNEYRPTWCIDYLPWEKPQTTEGSTASDGTWTDHTWWSGDYGNDWCGKANQYWRAGGCADTDLHFCQQWYPTGVSHTQKPACEICNVCTPE